MKKILIVALIIAGYYIYQQRGSKNAKPLSDPIAATELAQESDKILIISVGSEKCGRCQVIKESVKNGDVDFDKEHFVWVDIDYYEESMRWFRKNYRLNVKSFPTFLAVSSNGKVLNHSKGMNSILDLNIFLNKARLLDRKQHKS